MSPPHAPGPATGAVRLDRPARIDSPHPPRVCSRRTQLPAHTRPADAGLWPRCGPPRYVRHGGGARSAWRLGFPAAATSGCGVPVAVTTPSTRRTDDQQRAAPTCNGWHAPRAGTHAPPTSHPVRHDTTRRDAVQPCLHTTTRHVSTEPHNTRSAWLWVGEGVFAGQRLAGTLIGMRIAVRMETHPRETPRCSYTRLGRIVDVGTTPHVRPSPHPGVRLNERCGGFPWRQDRSPLAGSTSNCSAS
jgi:hypothetical protein